MKKNIFGTDGIRASVGTHPLTIDSLVELGKSIGQWAVEKYTTPRILIAHDTRASGLWVTSALQTGLLTHPIHLDLADVLPTPAVVQLLKHSSIYHCGIMISASHNPYHDNGIKIIDAKLGKISAADEARISELFYTGNQPSYTSFGTFALQHNKHEDYIQRILSYFDSTLLQGKRVVLDCANGATSYVAPAIFKALGANVITLNNQPSGTNINYNCGALHPDNLQRAVIEHKAHIGFAFDGDGDRVIAVNNKGEFKDGDDLLALLALHPEYSKYHTVVGTIMANQGLEDYLQSKGKLLLRTKVGDKYIAQEIEAYKLMVGGEQSGHIILNDYLPTGDGIFAALRTCHAITITNNWDMKTFTKYPQILKNITVSSKKDLSTSPLSDIIEATQSKIGSGRILVRYSGTEPVLRIMAEAQDHNLAQEAVNSLCQQLLHLL